MRHEIFDDYSKATAAAAASRLKIKSRMEVKGGVSP